MSSDPQKKKLPQTKKHIGARLAICRQHLREGINMLQTDWNTMIGSDKTSITNSAKPLIENEACMQKM
jgi:hypothetical protein